MKAPYVWAYTAIYCNTILRLQLTLARIVSMGVLPTWRGA